MSKGDYYPFGGVFNSYTSGTENLYKYNGQEEQKELETYAYDFRMYDPMLGRWWQADPVYKFHESPHAWVTNNPIRYMDVLGLDTVDINYNNDGIWEITNTQMVKGDDIFRVNEDGETTTHTFSEGEYGKRVNMLNLENTDDHTLGVYHISGEEIELGRTRYYVTPGGDASIEAGSNARLPADVYDLESSPSGVAWEQVWVTNGASSGDVSGRGVKFHFGKDKAKSWTKGCFILSSSYTKSNNQVNYDFQQSRVSLMLMDYHLGATSIYKYKMDKYNGVGRTGASFGKTKLVQKLILKDGF